MKRSTLIRLGATAVAIGFSVYGGGALTSLLLPLLAAGNAESATEGLGKVAEELAVHLFGGLFEDWSNDQDKEVLNGMNAAVVSCLELAAQQNTEPQKAYLLGFAGMMRNGKLPRKIDDVNDSLDSLDLPGLLSGQQHLSAAEWAGFLQAFAPEVPQSPTFILLDLNGEKRAAMLREAGKVFETNFSRTLREVYKNLGPDGNRAWQDLFLKFLIELHRTVQTTGRNVQGLAEHLNTIERRLADLKGSSLPAGLSETFLESLQQQVKATQELVRALEDRVPRLESAFAISAAPIAKLPFLYTLRDTELRGDSALNMLAHDFQPFLEDDRAMCWWLWTGLEGAGKSRLAMEACTKANGLGWKAGFVSQEKLKHFSDHWGSCTIEGDVLLVFDYAGENPSLVRHSLFELVARASGRGQRAQSGKRWRVRFLLLERHVGPLSPTDSSSRLPQWCQELFAFGPSRPDTDFILAAQYPSAGHPSFYLGALDPQNARALASQYLAHLDATGRFDPSSGQSLSLEERETIAVKAVKLVDNITRPLHIMIAARVLRDIRDKDFGDFDAVMLAWLNERVPRRQDMLERIYKGESERLLNLVCVATVLGQVQLKNNPALSHPLLPPPGVLQDKRFLQILEQNRENDFLSKLEPDLIGEWFVLYRTEVQTSAGLTPQVLAEIVEKCPDSKRGLAAFVQRTYRYFHDKTLPEGNKSALWRVLRGSLGRYATTFGELFDRKQAQLLGGTTKEAEAYYTKLVIKNIEAAIQRVPGGVPLVVDLMAGGSGRPQELLDHFGSKIMLLVIDRDDSRLRLIQPPERDLFRIKSLQVDENFSLASVLEEAFFQKTCDVVIAKKALHELPWKSQCKLIAEIGNSLSAGGSAVLYTDSPNFMDNSLMSGWARRDHSLRDILAIDGPDDSPEARKKLFPPELKFDPANPSAAAIFTNCWIKLKDWANYNGSEYKNRYFSSCNQIKDAFVEAGLEMHVEPQRFCMEIQATRFVEEAINRLGYLCVDESIQKQDLSEIFSQNHRYSLFWSFAEEHLWPNGAPSEFGFSVGAKMEDTCFDELLPEVFLKEYGPLNIPSLRGPSFRMPIHIFEFRKPQ